MWLVGGRPPETGGVYNYSERGGVNTALTLSAADLGPPYPGAPHSIVPVAGMWEEFSVTLLNPTGDVVAFKNVERATFVENTTYIYSWATNSLTPASKPPLALPGVNWTVLILLGLLVVATKPRRKG